MFSTKLSHGSVCVGHIVHLSSSLKKNNVPITQFNLTVVEVFSKIPSSYKFCDFGQEKEMLFVRELVEGCYSFIKH